MNIEYPLKLSIIVPVYNVEKYLERCVNSLLHQDIDKSEYEIILVNDGSTDSSYEKAEKLKEGNANIVLFTQENKGQSAARNVGMELAKGKYIMFVDSDDLLEPDVFGTLITTSEHNNLQICYYSTIFEYEDGRVRNEQQSLFETNVNYDGNYLLLNGFNPSSVWQCVYKNEFLRKSKVSFFEGIIHEDVDFSFRLIPLAKRVMFTNILVYHYFVWRENSILTNSPQKLMFQIKSNFQVAKNTKTAMNTDEYSKNVKEYVIRHMNSLVVINLLRLIKDTRLNADIKNECFDFAKKINVYPIQGKAKSWKTTVLGRLLSVEWLFKILMRITCVK